MNRLDILCVTKNFRSHTPSGGYDQLARYVATKVIGRRPITALPMKMLEKLWHFGYGEKRHLFSHLSHGYRFEDRYCEEAVFWNGIARRPDIIHFLYGDWMLDAILRRRSLLPSRLVATFHLPADDVAQRFECIQRNELANLDGAILVSSHDLERYASWLGRKKVMYIPHGVDTDVFSPVPFRPRPIARFLFVGMMMRDFETAHRVFDQCRHDNIEAEFIVVTPKGGASFFTGCTNICQLSNIGELDLIDLYRKSDALFLPLLNSTANNAILEAMACGVPVISTNVGGVPDYVDSTAGWLLPPGDFDSAYTLVRDIVKFREIALEKRSAARTRAEIFSWQRVAETTLAAYRRLLRDGRLAPF